MSNPYGAAPAPPQPAPGPAVTSDHSSGDSGTRTIVGVVLGVLVVAVLAAGVTSVTIVDSPPHPEAWDPSVADLAMFVQDERGMLFDEPVFVDFQGEDEFVDDLTEDDEVTDEDREDMDDQIAELRALGLVEGDIDLFAEGEQLSGEATGAYYNPTTERITVRGTELTPYLRSMLVHELTHALQDQHFDLDAMRDSAGPDGEFIFRSVVEGDATNTQNAYIEEFSDDEADQFDEESGSASEDVDLEGVSSVLQAVFTAPYGFGPSFMGLIAEDGGNPSLNRMFENLPKSEADLFDPSRALDGVTPADVQVAQPEADQEYVDSGDFGALAWYLVLASRLDSHDALEFVDGWAGDDYVTYRDADRVCVRIRYQAETDADAERGLEILDEWTAAMPDGSASAEAIGADEVELNSCDPGAAAETDQLNDAVEALQLPVMRLQLAQQVLIGADGQVTFDEAWCLTSELVDELSIEQLQSDSVSDELLDVRDRALVTCDITPGG